MNQYYHILCQIRIVQVIIYTEVAGGKALKISYEEVLVNKV